MQNLVHTRKMMYLERGCIAACRRNVCELWTEVLCLQHSILDLFKFAWMFQYLQEPLPFWDAHWWCAPQSSPAASAPSCSCCKLQEINALSCIALFTARSESQGYDILDRWQSTLPRQIILPFCRASVSFSPSSPTNSRFPKPDNLCKKSKKQLRCAGLVRCLTREKGFRAPYVRQAFSLSEA